MSFPNQGAFSFRGKPEEVFRSSWSSLLQHHHGLEGTVQTIEGGLCARAGRPSSPVQHEGNGHLKVCCVPRAPC
jgi:hypothetical protein